MSDYEEIAGYLKVLSSWLMAGNVFVVELDQMAAFEALMTERGALSREIAREALFSRDPAAKEKGEVAKWLQEELDPLRAQERTGTAPVRNGRCLSRMQIAHTAFALLERTSVAEELKLLLAQLLDIDRHRRSHISVEEWKVQKMLAATAEAQLALQGRPIGVRKLAKLVGVGASTITAWRNEDEYRKSIKEARKEYEDRLRTRYFATVLKESPGLSDAQAFRRAFSMYCRDCSSTFDTEAAKYGMSSTELISLIINNIARYNLFDEILGPALKAA